MHLLRLALEMEAFVYEFWDERVGRWLVWGFCWREACCVGCDGGGSKYQITISIFVC